MRVTLITVVDITETNARKQDDKIARSQQANYLTMLQTIGLRVNAQPVSCKHKVGDVTKIGFGSAITGKQRYWEFLFEHEYEGAITQETLTDDFDLVPIITGLNETATINNYAFRTKDETERNIVFKLSHNE
jgi:hypothetical protein